MKYKAPSLKPKVLYHSTPAESLLWIRLKPMQIHSACVGILLTQVTYLLF